MAVRHDSTRAPSAPSPLRLATQDGKRIGRAKRTAEPASEVARLRRCLARIRSDAEKAHQHAEDSEKLLQAVLTAACGSDPLVTRAMAREACISGPTSYHFKALMRACEMAEDGSLCA